MFVAFREKNVVYVAVRMMFLVVMSLYTQTDPSGQPQAQLPHYCGGNHNVPQQSGLLLSRRIFFHIHRIAVQCELDYNTCTLLLCVLCIGVLD